MSRRSKRRRSTSFQIFLMIVLLLGMFPGHLFGMDQPVDVRENGVATATIENENSDSSYVHSASFPVGYMDNEALQTVINSVYEAPMNNPNTLSAPLLNE